MSRNSFKVILRFLVSDRQNLFFFAFQFVLSSICSALVSLEFVALAVFIPVSSNLSPIFQKILPKIQDEIWLIPVIIGLFCLRSVLNYFDQILQAQWNVIFETKQRRRLLRNLLLCSAGELEHQEPGVLAQKIDLESSQLSQLPNFVLKYWIQIPLLVTQTLFVCWMISWKIAFVLVPTFGIYYVLRIQISKKSGFLSKQAELGQGLEKAQLLNLFYGLSILKIFGAEKLFSDHYFKFRTQIQDKKFEFLKQKLFFSELTGFLMTISLMTSVAYVFFILKSSVQDVLLLIGTVKQLHDPLKNYSYQRIEAEKAVCLIETTQEVEKSKIVFLSRVQKYQIEFESVSYSYSGANHWKLKPISFQIRAGEKIALIGPNGSGKSTILKLLAGFYTGYEGFIYFSEIRSHCEISYAIQKPFLFSGTISDNISLYQNLSTEQIEEAAWQSGASEFIKAMPKQYQSYISNDGSGLSGGQRQKIHLARSFARQTPILLLDEATSALDLQSEQAILSNCRQQHWQTQIVVSHRKEILDWADRIIEIGL